MYHAIAGLSVMLVASIFSEDHLIRRIDLYIATLGIVLSIAEHARSTKKG
jgi:hypothetical protein